MDSLEKNGEESDFFVGKVIIRGAIFCIALFVAYKLMLISYKGLINLATYDTGGIALTLISSYAWLVFIFMGGFWVVDSRLGRVLPITGTISGVISILASIAGIILMPFVLLLLVSLVKFAYHLSKFHYEKPGWCASK